MTNAQIDLAQPDPRIHFDLTDGVATITISQPEKRNAIAPPMWDAIAAWFEHCSADQDVRVVIFQGDGNAFCSGSDVDVIGLSDDIPGGLARLRRANRMIRAIYLCEKPVIAVVRGPAVGVGWSLTLACDFTLAAENAKFGGGFLKVGLIPDGAAIFFLSRALGEARAKALVYSSRLVKADEAVSLGLALEAVPLDQMDERVMQFANELKNNATAGIALAKRMFRASLSPGIDAYFDAEEMAQICAKKTDDFQEGLASFKEGRPSRFIGR